jgi:hypothetical protein
VLCLLSYVRVLKPPAGVEPAPRPYKGRVLAVDTTEACDGDGGSRTHSSSLQARRSSDRATSPGADGWSRTTTAGGHGVTARRAHQCSASAGRGRSAGFEPEPRGSRPRMLPLHHDHHVGGDDRTRTGACSPDKRVLLPLSYVPLHSAGGIRTHDLELMRLAGTATPLRRDLPGWSRTSDLRRPKPAGYPTPLQAAVNRLALNRSRCRSKSSRSKSSWLGEAEPDFDRLLRRQGSNLRFAINSRASYRSTTPER